MSKMETLIKNFAKTATVTAMVAAASLSAHASVCAGTNPCAAASESSDTKCAGTNPCAAAN